ncbi:hypothetical protein BD309DRAFT_962441 [Dichomitus squalens]|nr:hypothetical protein BD309DRAFT_962441 [Dichomitus squalens]
MVLVVLAYLERPFQIPPLERSPCIMEAHEHRKASCRSIERIQMLRSIRHFMEALEGATFAERGLPSQPETGSPRLRQMTVEN